MMKNRDNHLEIRLFRFNHSVDYLPYYKTYNIKYDKNDCVYDLLNSINEIDQFSYDEKEKCSVNINSYFISSDVLIKDIVRIIGDELTIEPISLYRVTNDLVINTDDYDTKLALFDCFLNDEQKEVFKEKYKLEYYASHTMIVHKDYIGDHLLLIADELIRQNPNQEKDILDIISSKDNGIFYHTSLKKRIFQNRYDVEEVYERLLHKIPQYKNIITLKKEKSVLPEDLEIKQFFKGFFIAVYNTQGCIYRKLVQKSRASYIHLDSRRDDLALNSQLVNKEFSLKIAGKILLEAKDRNADFLIVQDQKDLEIFDAMQKKIETVVNRDIDLPVITEAQFVMLLQGEKNISSLGFLNHTIKVPFLDA
ncbi:MAG: DUF5644 domain-containing protein [Arcobacteraceae bacterium]